MMAGRYTPVDLSRTSGVVPDGVHTVRLEKFDEIQGPSGYPYWKYIGRIEEGGPYDGNGVFIQVSTSPAARFKMESFLNAVGAPEKGEVTGDRFVGVYIRVKIKNEEHEGKMQPKPQDFLPASGSPSSSPKTPAAPRAPSPVKAPAATPTVPSYKKPLPRPTVPARQEEPEEEEDEEEAAGAGTPPLAEVPQEEPEEEEEAPAPPPARSVPPIRRASGIPKDVGSRHNDPAF
jgi:hypothetical protein